MERTDREAHVADIATLDQPLRRQLYALLIERDDWLGRDAAAETLEVPRSVAAFHLDKLAEAGLVEVRFARLGGRDGPGAGRPAKLYRRSVKEVAVSLPDRRYELVGAILSDAVTDAAATGRPIDVAIADAARQAGHQIGTAVRDDLPTSRTSADVRPGVLRALERLGYEPRICDSDIVLANCPFHRLAARHRSLICGMNLDLLRGMTEGLPASERPAPRLEPAEGLCCVRLGPPRSRLGS